MNPTFRLLLTLPLVVLLEALLTGCDPMAPGPGAETAGHGEAAEPEMPRGPHGGRLLEEGDFALELAIFETGVPPEFRAWASRGGQAVPPAAVDLKVTLTRLGDIRDEIGFEPSGDFLRGDTVVYEPHSFSVAIEARHAGATHRWSYDSFEGRTRIEPAVAEAFGLETATAGPATIREQVRVYGRIVANPERVRHLQAGFPGRIEAVRVRLGDRVRAGQPLVVVRSNESLAEYTLTAPIGGTVAELAAQAGEQTGDRRLLTLIDTSEVWAELAVFPQDRARAAVGAPVTVADAHGTFAREGSIDRYEPVARDDQSLAARVVLDNADGALVPGMYVTADILVGGHPVPLAVERVGLQAFRDFTVVYQQIGDQYEVRMLELGRQDAERIEVLGGIEPGARYVTANSYLIKADIEKSGATHDH